MVAGSNPVSPTTQKLRFTSADAVSSKPSLTPVEHHCGTADGSNADLGLHNGPPIGLQTTLLNGRVFAGCGQTNPPWPGQIKRVADVLRPVETSTSTSVHASDLTAGQVRRRVKLAPPSRQLLSTSSTRWRTWRRAVSRSTADISSLS